MIKRISIQKMDTLSDENVGKIFLCVPSMVQFLSGVSPDTGIYRQV